MAIFKPSSLVSIVSGTIGGVTYCYTRGSQVARQPKRYHDQDTALQLAERRRIAWTTELWRECTDSQRQAWGAAARIMARTNRLGEKRVISGFQLFTASWSDFYPYPIGVDTVEPADRITNIMPITECAFSASGDWTITFGRQNLDYDDVWIQMCRPVTSAPRSTFTNWKQADWGTPYPDSYTLWQYWPRPDWLQGVEEGEVIGVRLKARAYNLGYTSLASPWVNAVATVTA